MSKKFKVGETVIHAYDSVEGKIMPPRDDQIKKWCRDHLHVCVMFKGRKQAVIIHERHLLKASDKRS